LGVEWIARRSRQAIETCHHQHVAGRELSEHAAELSAVGLSAACRLPVDFLAAGGTELAHLRLNALAFAARRYARATANTTKAAC
jgi:hypothetical protein